MKKIIIMWMFFVLMASCVQEHPRKNDWNTKKISQSESIKIPKKLDQEKLAETEEMMKEYLEIQNYELNYSLIFHNNRELLKKLLEENKKAEENNDIYIKAVLKKYMDSLFLVDWKYYVSEFVNQSVAPEFEAQGYIQVFSIDAKTWEEQELAITSDSGKHCTWKKECKHVYRILFVSEKNKTIVLTSSFWDDESDSWYFEVINIENGKVEKILPKNGLLYWDETVLNTYFYDEWKMLYFDEQIWHIASCNLHTFTCKAISEPKIDANLPDSEREKVLKLWSPEENYKEFQKIITTYNKEKNSIIIPIYNDEYIEKEKREVVLK